MIKGSSAPPDSAVREAKAPDISLISIDDLDVLIRSLKAIVELARRTKRKLESADLQSGLSKRNDL